MKKGLLILSLGLFTTNLLVSCGGSETIAQTTKYQLTCNKSENVEVTFTETFEDGIEAGKEISFTAKSLKENIQLSEVLFNGKVLLLDAEGKYSFTMPSKNSTLEIKEVKLGEDDLLNEGTIPLEMLPNTFNDVNELIKSSASVEGIYFKNGTYSKATTETYESIFDYKIYAYKDAIQVKGNTKSSSDKVVSSPYFLERGIFNSKYYEYTKEDAYFNDFSSEATIEEKLSVFNIKEENDETFNSSYDKKRSDAETLTTSYELSKVVLNWFEDSYEGINSISDSNKKFTTTVNEAKTSMDIDVLAYETSWSGDVTFHKVRLTFDSNKFLTQGTYQISKYAEADFDTTKFEPKENATYLSLELQNVSLEKGYKTFTNNKINLPDYAMKNYQVEVEESLEGTTRKVSDGKVAIGSTLKLYATSNDEHVVLIKPTILGSKEEGFLVNDGMNFKVAKEGDFTLLVDNGVGEIKEIKLTAARPALKEIIVNLDKTAIEVNGKAKLTYTTTPSSANNEVTVTGDETIVKIEKVEDYYEITGLKVGETTLKVTSVENPEIFKEVKLTVEAPITEETVKEFITTKTLYTEYSYYDSSNYSDEIIRAYINFGADNKGQYRIAKNDYWSGSWNYQTVVEFDYTLDFANKTITLTETSSLGYGQIKITKLDIVRTSEYKMTFEAGYYDYQATIKEGKDRIEDLNSLQ